MDIECEHPNFANTRAPAILMAKDVVEVIKLTKIAKKTCAKSSANWLMHAAANIDAFTCIRGYS